MPRKSTGETERRGDRSFRPERPSHAPKKPKTNLACPDRTSLPATPAKGTDRVAKAIARAGLASRREAEQWIAAGRVAVNGAVITSPAINVGPADMVTVDGKPLPARERTRLFLYHKPRGLLTTTADAEGRPTIFDALPKHLPRVVSIGRLDLNTEGLLLLTNDGGLARVIELPETGWLRRYRVRAHGRVTQAQLDALRDGIEIDGIRYGPIEATLDRDNGSNVWLTFAIREGKNREVRNVLRALDLQVNRLIRISFGPFQLGELAQGQVEEVRTRILREQIGERLASLSGADFTAPLIEREPVPAAAGPDRPPRSRLRKQSRARSTDEKPRREASGRKPRRRDEEPRRAEKQRAPGAGREEHSIHGPGPGGRDAQRPETRDQRQERSDGRRSDHVWRRREAREAPGAAARKPRHFRKRPEIAEQDVPEIRGAGLRADRKGRKFLFQRVGAKRSDDRSGRNEPRDRPHGPRRDR